MKKAAAKEETKKKKKKAKLISSKKIDDTFYKLRDFLDDYVLYQSFSWCKELDNLSNEMRDVQYEFSANWNDAEMQGKLVKVMIDIDNFVTTVIMEEHSAIFSEKVMKEWSKIEQKITALNEQAEKNGLFA